MNEPAFQAPRPSARAPKLPQPRRAAADGPGRLWLDGSPLYTLCFRAAVPFLLALYADLHVSQRDRIPKDGPLIVVSNHVDNLDAYVIGSQIPRLLHYLARADGLRSRWLGLYWRLMATLPADREGFGTALTLLREGHAIGVFAEGRIAPALVRAKPGVALLALRTGAPVLPCAIWGTEQIHAGDLGRRRAVWLRFGAPRTLARGSGRSQELADRLMCEVAALLPASYRGVYA